MIIVNIFYTIILIYHGGGGVLVEAVRRVGPRHASLGRGGSVADCGMTKSFR